MCKVRNIMKWARSRGTFNASFDSIYDSSLQFVTGRVALHLVSLFMVKYLKVSLFERRKAKSVFAKGIFCESERPAEREWIGRREMGMQGVQDGRL